MSMRQSTYIGAYIECLNPLNAVTKTEAGCVNESCARYHKPVADAVLYCYQCGKPVGDYQVTEHEPAVNKWDVSEKIDQDFWPPEFPQDGVDFWLPNKGGGVDLDLPEDGGLIEIHNAGELKSEHITHLLERYDAAIKTLTAVYGLGNVRIKWGVVVYWN
jgi:hypothetical protein